MAARFHVAAVAGVALLAALYYFGVEHSWFWIYGWYDIPMHMLGGAVIGAWAAGVASRLGLPPVRALALIVLAALAVSVAWEGWEYAAGLTSELPNYWLDTGKDLADDLFGALLAWGAYVLLRREARGTLA